MSKQSWSDLIARITPQEPGDIDSLLADLAPRQTQSGQELACSTKAMAYPAVELEAEDQICFAARVADDGRDTVTLAMSLAQIALQKDAEPVIFSQRDKSGLEKFGFRVERVCGGTDEDRKAGEDQLKAFWGIVMVI